MKTVFFFASGIIACTDDDGVQIAQLQESVFSLWAQLAERQGFDPAQFEIETTLGPGAFEKIDGRWELSATKPKN